jgi:hypothetical protein
MMNDISPQERLLRVFNKQIVDRPPVICPGGMMNAAIVDIMNTYFSSLGGMTLERVPEMLQVYGPDVIFLIGGGLFKYGPNLIESCQHFCSITEQAVNY